MVSLPPYLRRGGCAPRPRSRSTAGQDRARTRGWYRAGAAPPGPSPLSSARAAHPTVTAGTIPKNTRAPTGMRARQGNSAAARASPRSDQKPTGSSAGEQNGAHSGTARPGYSRSPAQPAPGDARAPHRGIPEPRTPAQPRVPRSAGTRTRRRERCGTPSPAPGPPLPPARPLPLPAAKAPGGRAPLDGGSRDGAKLPSSRAHCAGGPGWRARSGAAPRIPRGTQAGGRRGEAGAGPAPRPVPCRVLARPQLLPPQRGEPAVPGASCLLPRTGIAEQRAAGPAPLHPAARPEPPQLCHADSPLGWEVGFFSPLSPSRRTPPAPSSSPGHSPPLQPEPFPGRRCRALPIAAESLPPPCPPRCGARSPQPARGSRMRTWGTQRHRGGAGGELGTRSGRCQPGGAGQRIPVRQQGWRGGTRPAPAPLKVFQRVGRERWAALRVPAQGLSLGCGTAAPALGSICILTLKWYRLNSGPWNLSWSVSGSEATAGLWPGPSGEDGWITPAPKITLRSLSVQSLVPTAPWIGLTVHF